jgi:hypothetical protein
MKLPRSIWKNNFNTDNIPNWPCPHCSIGILESNKGSFSVMETEASKRFQKELAWEPEWTDGVFSGILTCNNNKCNEKTIVSGKMSVEASYFYDKDGNQDQSYEESLTPLLFIPALKVLEISSECPAEIEEAVIESFKLFWVDSSSCCNKIRIVVELIMNQQRVGKTYLKGKKRKRYNLHDRIVLFAKKRKAESEQLMAIKWIGNSGSHSSDKNTKDDALDAYDILENVLNRLYQKTTHIEKLSKKINKRKKPNSNKRRRKGIWGAPNKSR